MHSLAGIRIDGIRLSRVGAPSRGRISQRRGENDEPRLLGSAHYNRPRLKLSLLREDVWRKVSLGSERAHISRQACSQILGRKYLGQILLRADDSVPSGGLMGMRPDTGLPIFI